MAKLDVLDSFDVVRVAVAYKSPSTGEELSYFPADIAVLEACEVTYREFPGWQCPTTHIKTYVRRLPRLPPCVSLLANLDSAG